MIYVLIICSFVGGADYQCDQGIRFDDVYECERYADEVSESKGLTAYCVTEYADELQPEMPEI